MLNFQSISLSVGGRQLLDNVSFVVNAGECVGVVGPNGCGKSTLLRIASGALTADSGTVVTPKGSTIGYLPQDGVDGRVGTAAEAFPALFQDDLAALAQELAEAQAPEDVKRLSARYETALEAASGTVATRMDDAWAVQPRVIDGAEPLERLSGGERTRLAIMNLAASRPDIVLLDEPTNHLDLQGIRWLERFIRGYEGAVIVVSHDRAMLDACASSIVELDPRTGSATMFAGNYADLATERTKRDTAQREAYQRQRTEERRRKRVISAIESRARNIENETIDFHYRKRAKKVARRSTTLKARLEREAASESHVERPDKPITGPSGRFLASARGPARALSLEGLSLGFAGRTLIEGAHLEILRGERVCLTGPNGSGKTTLVRAILGEHQPLAGRIEVSQSANVGYIGQEGPARQPLGSGDESAVEVVRRWSPMTGPDATNFLHWFFFTGDQMRTRIGDLSLGERQRLALARFFLEPTALLVLDEPTNHLDIPAKEAFEESLAGFEGGALIVTHDRHFIDEYADRVYEVAEGRLRLG